MQMSPQIDEPDYGDLLDDMFFDEGSTHPDGALHRSARRGRACLRAAADGSPGPGCTLDDVLSATEYVTPAIEIIDARIQQIDPATGAPRRVTDTISDNAANAGVVLGGRQVAPSATSICAGSRALLSQRRDRGVGRVRGGAGSPGERRRLAREQARDVRARRSSPAMSSSRARSSAPFPPGPATTSAPTSVRSERSRSASPEGRAMNTPVNGFKQSLAARRVQIGLWLGLADPYCAEICAGAGFDWLALDAEHGPNTIRTLLSQLQAVASYPVHAVVRAAHGDLHPLEAAARHRGADAAGAARRERRAGARGCPRERYPPDGIRGVGSALARASRWNRHADYLQRADAQICVIVQAESAAALSHLSEIARVEGVDGVFLGPADLAASLGIEASPRIPWFARRSIVPLRRSPPPGKAAGILTSDETLARGYLTAGCSFVAVVSIRRRSRARPPHSRSASRRASPGIRRAGGLTRGRAMRKFDQSLPMALLRARELDELLPAVAQCARAHRAAVARHPRAAGIRRARVPRPVARGLDPAGEPDGHPHAGANALRWCGGHARGRINAACTSRCPQPDATIRDRQRRGGEALRTDRATARAFEAHVPDEDPARVRPAGNDGWRGVSTAGVESLRNIARRRRAHSCSQTDRATSTTSSSFRHCSSSDRALPWCVLEKPHWGDRHRRSSGT